MEKVAHRIESGCCHTPMTLARTWATRRCDQRRTATSASPDQYPGEHKALRDIAEVVSITSVFPQTVVETCIVHLIRNSLVASARITKALLIPMFRMQFDDLAFLGGRRAFHPSDVGIHLIFGIEY
jgi:hypothetical protein